MKLWPPESLQSTTQGPTIKRIRGLQDHPAIEATRSTGTYLLDGKATWTAEGANSLRGTLIAWATTPARLATSCNVD
jgi:hypothetical protein